MMRRPKPGSGGCSPRARCVITGFRLRWASVDAHGRLRTRRGSGQPAVGHVRRRRVFGRPPTALSALSTGFGCRAAVYSLPMAEAARPHSPARDLQSPGQSQTVQVAVPGVALVAACYGFARYGYGVLVPDMRGTFSMDGTTVGLIASGGYVAYLIATVAAVLVIARVGPRRTALLGGVMAVTGMIVMATASDVAVLATGLVVAGASSGFAFPPFAALTADHIVAQRRGTALATISSGTGWG